MAQPFYTIIGTLSSRDRNVYRLYQLLKNGSKSFHSILQSFEGNVSESQLIALIDLINRSEKDGIGLFDLKYHSFVRPLSGAYVTIGPNPKLSLTKTNALDELRAFEVGNCKYCSAPYIIGKIKVDETNGLEYLFQNREVDIYENYGHNEFVKLDFFLLNKSIEEEVDISILEDYAVCAKCGCISSVKNKKVRTCGCGEQYRTIIYKVNQKKANTENVFNNINQCPACGNKSASGLIKSLNLGKDEGTALVSQILYEAIDEEEKVVKHKPNFSLVLHSVVKNEEKPVSKVKQFLAFSDSRQQASFFATFFESNHTRMLQKRLIWRVIEENEFKDLTANQLVAYLTEIIKNNNLFKNGMEPHKNAWVAVLVDLLKVDGMNDGEGLGLYYFDLNLESILDQFSEEQVAEAFGKYGINKSDLENVMQVLFSVFKVTPAINYVKSTLEQGEKKDYLEYRRFDNYVMLQSSASTNSIRSLLPISGKDNMAVRYIKKTFGCDDDAAKEVITILFQLLVDQREMENSEAILIKDVKREAYQIDARRYVLKNYKTSKYYQCNKCGRLTPYNVHNKCVKDRCSGELFEVDPDQALKSNFYRTQYKMKKVEPIVVEEHTAQLDRKKAKQYQGEFKDKKINILSCSTTFEMGVDIGNLEYVFMRNVPPSPANYVQRAGRAGRRKDNSAYILTYCGTGSHDYTYFLEPERMISGIIRPPYFNVLNKKIIVRHLMATCLGHFFRTHRDYFNSIEALVFNNGIEEFKRYIMSHPSDLNEYINHRILPGGVYDAYRDFKWFDEMEGRDEKLVHFVNSILDLYKEYENAKHIAEKEEQYRDVDYYNKMMKSLLGKNVIDSLSKYCVIPKYGFPVDVVDLEIYDSGKKNVSYDLSRDLRIAIAEYAPDSEVIVDKNKYTSKYISLPKTAPFPKKYFRTCPNCRKVNVTVSNRASECKYCNTSLEDIPLECYIEPVLGFKTGSTKESTRMKPKRSYAGEVIYLGQGAKDDNMLRLGNYMTVETSSEDKLLVMNKSKFYMCPVCGYSDKVVGSIEPHTMEKEHNNYSQYKCQCGSLNLIRLGHSFETDVTRFMIPILDSSDKMSYSKALSFMYAFLEGVSLALGIERNDIDGVLEFNSEEGCFDVLLYDNVPGGAGHVKRLMKKSAIVAVLQAALAKVSQDCCDEETSCYNCLRNYYNQMYHNKLRRSYAKECIESLLSVNNEKEEYFSRMTKEMNQGVGSRPSNYRYHDDGKSRSDTVQSLGELKEMISDEGVKKGIEKLMEYANGKNYECPHVDESIPVDVAVWPDLFWPKSKVALFLPENSLQYERLRVYDWHCFIVDENIEPHSVLANIQEEH